MFSSDPQGNDLKRINNLSGFVAGMIETNSSHLSSIGSGLPQNTDAMSKEIAAKRFVENSWTSYEEHYLPFVGKFLGGIFLMPPPCSEILMVIDGSQMGKNHATLMFSLVWRKRAIPLCWFTKKGSKGHFTEQDHVELIERARKLIGPFLPQTMTVTLLGDGEFDGIKVQELCLSQGWNYVLRTACDTVMYENAERFQPKTIAPADGETSFFIPNVEFTKSRFQYVNYVCWHDRKKHKDPIHLVSNLSEAGDIIERYDERFSIECLFKDLKSTSFNLHKTRLKNPLAISNLLIIGSLAFILLLSLGIQFEESPQRKKIQRVRKNREVLSIFTYACKLIRFLTKRRVPFEFSFQFSKNDGDFFQTDT